MLIAYWIVAGLLAVFYLYSGGMKLLRPKDALRPMMGWWSCRWGRASCTSAVASRCG